MVDRRKIVVSETYDPYQNLALEEYLFQTCQETECILYLWQNEQTVVIGRNQNAWKECEVTTLEQDGGHLVRRLSGGGAVYHDLGNVNFTFLARKENYDKEKQLEVILRAVKKLGVPAEKSGRNDLLANGRKFSGNAYFEQDGHCYHHGTLMLQVDVEKMSRYLTVSKEKLQSKGVDSVRSRVVNLCDIVPDITPENLKQALKEAFEEVYEGQEIQGTMEELDQRKVEALREKFSSWQWNFGKEFQFQHELSKRFDWGQTDLQLQVENGRIKEARVYSDALGLEAVQELPKYLKNVRYRNDSMHTQLGLFWSSDPRSSQMMGDIRAWLGAVEL